MNRPLYPALARLVEVLPGLQMQHFTVSDGQIMIALTSTAPSASCPLCDTPSSSVHSSYSRSPTDLPWAGTRVQLQLRVRKFFCKAVSCTRRIFTERLPRLVATYARRTVRLSSLLAAIASALGGQAGARLSRHLSLSVSGLHPAAVVTANA